MADYNGSNTGAQVDAKLELAASALQPIANHGLYPDTSAIKLAKTVVSDIAGITGSAAITNVVSLTTAQYTALGSKNATTVYLITDAT